MIADTLDMILLAANALTIYCFIRAYTAEITKRENLESQIGALKAELRRLQGRP